MGQEAVVRFDAQVRAGVRVLLGLAGALLIVVGTTLPWYSRSTMGGGSTGTGWVYGEFLVLAAVVIAIGAVGAEFQPMFAVGNLVLAGLVVVLAWIELDRVVGINAGESAILGVDPQQGWWMLIAGATLGVVGSLWRLLRR